MVARSFLALKKQNGLETCRNVLKLSCADPLAVGQACWLLDSPERIAAVVRLLRSAYQSRITHSDALRLLKAGLSPFTNLRPLTIVLVLVLESRRLEYCPPPNSSYAERTEGPLNALILADLRCRSPLELRAIGPDQGNRNEPPSLVAAI
jgi:hypothetical protein